MILIKIQNEDFTVKSDPVYNYFTGSHIFLKPSNYSNQIGSKTENQNRHYEEKPNIWIKTWVEYYLVWQLASSTFSILTLCIKIIAFKINQSFLIIPNIVSLFIDVIINLLGFSVLLACILRIPKYSRFIYSVEILMIYQMAFLLASVCIHIISLNVTKNFYISLQNINNMDTNEIVY
uniref:Uncharacterized protein n=1 Tax=Strongyloides stercoralis TaxID=6248 RepID=A0A0K0EN93_STRER